MLDGVAIARRLPELQRQGLAIPTGRTVPSNTGRAEREWIAVLPRSVYELYRDEKAQWLAQNPSATPDQIEAESQRIAERLGI